MENTAKISIIIPVYNAEKYLNKCLNSVCRQTLKDIDIICIDDCSKDNSFKILKKYAKRDSRIRIIKKSENGGESAARNIGLQAAVGEYLSFIDNDDTIDPDFCEKLYNKALESNYDIVKANSLEIDYFGNKQSNDYNALIEKNNKDKFFFVTHWWTAIYKRSLILENNINFPEDRILGGDIVFLNKALLAAHSFEMINDTFYTHIMRPNSGDSEFLSLKKIRSAVNCYSDIITNLLSQSEYLSGHGYKYAISYYLNGIYTRFLHNDSSDSREICINKLFELNTLIKNNEEISHDISDKLPHIMYYLKTNNPEGLMELSDKYPIVPAIKLFQYRHKLQLAYNKEARA